MFNVHKVKIRGTPDYVCRVCGDRRSGDSVIIEAASIEEAQKRMALAPLPNGMPVGWASYGRYEYRCPNHVI